MPGLFGIIRLSQDGRTDARESRRILDRMAPRLVHHEKDTISRWDAPDGEAAFGRAGPADLHSVAWPPAPDDPRSRYRFVAGVLLADRSADHDRQPGAHGSVQPGPVDIRQLCGSFAIADFDSARHRVLLVADRTASIPVYYARLEDHVLFAPEISALLVDDRLSHELDPGAAAALLTGGHLLGDQTLLRGVRRLRGGEALVIEDGRCERWTYWRFAPGSRVDPDADEVELEVELGRLVGSAVARNLGEPERSMIFLSGGVDSRAILGGALDAVGGAGASLHTASWGVSHGSPQSDVAIASRIAASVGTKHQFMARHTRDYGRHVTRVNALVGSSSDVAAFHPLEYAFMGEIRRRGFVRVLRGDESFGWSAGVNDVAGAFREVRLRSVRETPQLAGLVRADHYAEWRDAADAVLATARQEVEGAEPNDAKDFLYFSHRLQGYLNTASYYKLCWLDQRNPLLDEEILDFLAVVPSRLRVEKLLFRRAVGRAFPNLMAFPIATQNNLEDWAVVLTEDEAVRSFVGGVLDGSSGLWEYLDRSAVQTLFTTATLPARAITARRRPNPFDWRSHLPPPVASRVRRWRTAHLPHRIRAHALLFRIITLAQFLDAIGSGNRLASEPADAGRSVETLA